MEYLGKILFVDDHKLIRTLTSNFLKQALGVEIVQAKNGQDGLNKFATDPCSFDLVITDVYMPVMDGLEMAQNIRSVDGNIKLVIFSMMDDLRTIKKMMKIGVQGYVLKEGDTKNLINGIKAVLKGEYHYSKSIIETLLSLSASEPRPYFSSELRRSEREVAELCFLGFSVIEISQILRLSYGEVGRRKAALLEKVNIEDLKQLKDAERVYKTLINEKVVAE